MGMNTEIILNQRFMQLYLSHCTNRGAFRNYVRPSLRKEAPEVVNFLMKQGISKISSLDDFFRSQEIYLTIPLCCRFFNTPYIPIGAFKSKYSINRYQKFINTASVSTLPVLKQTKIDYEISSLPIKRGRIEPTILLIKILNGDISEETLVEMVKRNIIDEYDLLKFKNYFTEGKE